MVGFLPPLVQEASLSGMAAVLLYAASSAAAGTAVGLLLGAAGSLVPGFAGYAVARGLLAAVAVSAAVVELRGGRPRLPEWRRQVPPSWRYDYGPWKAAAMYGASLGTGLTTYISYAGFYAVLACALASGARGGATLGALYGAAQCLPVVAAGFAALAGNRPPLHAQVLNPAVLHRTVGAACLLVSVWASIR